MTYLEWDQATEKLKQDYLMLKVIVVVPTVTGRLSAVACSIECARHNGYEPYRMPMGNEYDEACVFCGIDQED